MERTNKSPIGPVTLHGKYVTLEPLSEDHCDELIEAASDGDLWNLWYTRVPRPEEMMTEIQNRLAEQESGRFVPFATRLNDSETGAPGRVIGMTAYANIDPVLPRLEIGYTWNAASVQGTGTNPDSKRLLLTHAFETIGCEAVEFRTHWMNQQSRAAIARLGAKQDGVIRSHLRMPDGSLRDTVVFSIIASEWPMVRNGLDLRLAKVRP
ncbi:GNAT family N-acetyltransferase [Arthrobacter sp. 35W]|uniref:GNAT family N-acetyltransferase n=1 Tax=Arthrobacter sp. 35W TaxID=1132441 RepID=UPI000411FC5B|nr:GNAT family protein [Arthrobacter sp. 35W]